MNYLNSVTKGKNVLSKKDKLQRIYPIINIVVICFSLYMLALPLISPFMSKLFPNFWTCSYRAITNEPCPFCGVTTDLGNLNKGTGEELSNNISTYVHILLIVEIILRVIVSLILCYTCHAGMLLYVFLF
jgi:hypothetical protein